MSDDLYFGDKIILAGDYVYIDSDETTRLYNDAGVLKVQIKVSGAWVDQESWGS